MTMENKIVKVYVLKGLNGTSLVIENYRVSNKKNIWIVNSNTYF